MLIKPKKAPLVIHVNSHNIRSNRKLLPSHLCKIEEPVITVRYGRGAIAARCNGLEILGSSRLMYGDPLGCGAEVWIETESNVEIMGKDGD
jgi:hypothetical protein